MSIRWAQGVVCGIALAGLAACGGGSGASSATGSNPISADPPATPEGNLSVMVSDAPAQDWALVGVKIESIALVPQGGGSNVVVYSTSPGAEPCVNLVELDQLAEILGNASIPAGTYTGAIITVGGNPGDVLLTASADPESGFAGAPSTSIASQAIQIQHTQGSSGNLTVPIDVAFDSPLTVTAGSNDALDLEFDLSNPAFIIAHQPPGSGSTLWAVNFRGPVRHRPVRHVARLTLRELYGDVAEVAPDGSALMVNRVFRAWPIANPETAVQTMRSLTIEVDSQNGTLFYDVDGGSGPTKVTSFANLPGLAAHAYVRIQARFEEDGTLTATRVWAASTFNGVWVSPEGHVLHVDANPSGTSSLTVADEAGRPVVVDISNDTHFYFHGGSTAIGTDPAFLANIVRGFKVHVMDVVDPLAKPLVASDVDIETAAFSGALTNVDATQLTYAHAYVRASDDYQRTLPYISASTPNGTDGSGNAITGFKYWPFAYPTLLTSGPEAVASFVQATTALPGVVSYGLTDAKWGDPANATGWSAAWVDLLPSPLPLAAVANGLTGNQFTVTAQAEAYTIDVGTTSGSATLVYQVDRTGGIVSVSPIDITTPAGLASFTQALVSGTPVRVFGVPQSDATLQAYLIIYFTGNTLPVQ